MKVLLFAVSLIVVSVLGIQPVVADIYCPTTEAAVTMDLELIPNPILDLSQSTAPLLINFSNPDTDTSGIGSGGTITIIQGVQSKHLAWNFLGDNVDWFGVKPDLFLDPPFSTRVINWTWDGVMYSLSANPISPAPVDEFTNHQVQTPEELQIVVSAVNQDPNVRHRVNFIGDIVLEKGVKIQFGIPTPLTYLEIKSENGSKIVSKTNSFDGSNLLEIKAEHFVADGLEFEGWSGLGGVLKNQLSDDNKVFIVRNCKFRDCGTLQGECVDNCENTHLHTAGCVLGVSRNGIIEVEGCEFIGCNKSSASADHNVYVSAVHVLVKGNYSLNGGNAFLVNKGPYYLNSNPGTPYITPYQVSACIMSNGIVSYGDNSFYVQGDEWVKNPGAFYLFPPDWPAPVLYNIQHNVIEGEFQRVYHSYPLLAAGTFNNNLFDINDGSKFVTQIAPNSGVKSVVGWQQGCDRDLDSTFIHDLTFKSVLTGGVGHGFYVEGNDDFRPDGKLALGLWLYVPLDLTGPQWLASVADGGVNGSSQYVFSVGDDDGDGQYRALLRTGPTSWIGTSFGVIPKGEWCRIWFVLDEVGNCRKIYVDGIEKKKSNAVWESYTFPGHGTQRLGIGMIADSVPSSATGDIRLAGVEFWRAVPSEDDIEYDRDNPTKFMSERCDGSSLQFSDCKGYWRLNEGASTVVHDSSGNENDGTARIKSNLGWLGDKIDFELGKLQPEDCIN